MLKRLRLQNSALVLFVGAVGACATAPTRPALLDAPVGAPLVEGPELTDASVEDGIVEVTLPKDLSSAAGGLPIARAQVGDAVVLRGLGGSFHQIGSERVGVDDGVALLNPQRAGAFPIRSGAAAKPSAILLVADPTQPKPERVLLLGDKAQGIERLNGLGNQLVVNGQVRPTLKVAAGSTERWHLFNIAEERVFVVALPGHLLVKADGKTSGEVALAPGEGATVEVALALPAGTAVDLTTIDGDATVDVAEAWPLLRVLYVPQHPEKS